MLIKGACQDPTAIGLLVDVTMKLINVFGVPRTKSSSPKQTHTCTVLLGSIPGPVMFKLWCRAGLNLPKGFSKSRRCGQWGGGDAWGKFQREIYRDFHPNVALGPRPRFGLKKHFGQMQIKTFVSLVYVNFEVGRIHT